MTSFLEAEGPRWFTIEAHRPFMDDLARGLLQALEPLGPLALSEALVLTPTRRGARALTEALARAAAGGALLPPQIRPLGDLDEGEAPFEPGDLAQALPPAIGSLQRRLELMALVKAHEGALGRELGPLAALELAEALGGFFDSLQIEERESADLADLVDGDMAEHWQVSRRFLEGALSAWPARLQALGVSDVGARRVALLRALAARWSESPPKGVLVAAGSTGAAPATAALLAVIAAAPLGAVVLPGLDQALDQRGWDLVDPPHPQGAMKRLLAAAEVDRGTVALWPASPLNDPRSRRTRLVNEALRPAQATSDWLNVITELQGRGDNDGVDAIALGLEGMGLVQARTEDEAAAVAALALRGALEQEGRTAALITPDRALARRTAAKLARWGVVADSSLGQPLAGLPAGVLAGLAAQAAGARLDPVLMLGGLKHAFTRMGLERRELDNARDLLERYGLRGPARADRRALEAHLADKCQREGLDPAPALDLIARWQEALAPAADAALGTVSDAARGLAETLEALARDAAGDLGPLWSGAAGEGLARMLAELMAHGGDLALGGARTFAQLLQRLMEAETVRAGGVTHPRLKILGAIEARLVRADLVVLAGLEEGVWPQAAPQDPFLSRPMRERLGLPPPERRVGLSAHDFAQAAAAPEVILLHTQRRGGAPTVKSRWLWRLETLAKGAGTGLDPRPDLAAWARGLDAAQSFDPAPRPAPRPPVEHRPRRLAVTRVEALTRDPYAVWARDILKLYPLDRPRTPVDARARGSAIHLALERFTLAFPTTLPDDAADQFARLFVESLTDLGAPPAALAREGALAQAAGVWVAELERDRRADGRTLHAEVQGVHTLHLAGGPFTLTAKADRIEIDPAGFGHVLDFKTGAAPTAKMVATGFSPQLTLTAAILAAGGFPGLGSPAPGDLVYVQVTGRRPAGKVEVRAQAGEESAQAAREALVGLAELIALYDDPDRPYRSRVSPQFVRAYASDYDHLARVFEWSTQGEEGEA